VTQWRRSIIEDLTFVSCATVALGGLRVTEQIRENDGYQDHS
jgi:hypothetical protein